jgi:hypothetical protein
VEDRLRAQCDGKLLDSFVTGKLSIKVLDHASRLGKKA